MEEQEYGQNKIYKYVYRRIRTKVWNASEYVL